MVLDKERIFADWSARAVSAPMSLTAPKREALGTLLDFISADAAWTTVRQVAYLLATVRHETAGTFRPIKEYRAKPNTNHRVIQDRYWGTGFYGRGYVQLTWQYNYVKAGKRLHAAGILESPTALVETPDLLLTPRISYEVLARGMREGWYTGKSLADYINDTKTDYLHARRIVNGMDQAQRIAQYATEFELLIRAAR